METVTDFIFLESKISADGTVAMKLKEACSLGKKKKVMTNLGNILKSRDITLLTKVRTGKAKVYQLSCMHVRVGP